MITFDEIHQQMADIEYLKTVCPEYTDGNCTAVAMSALLEQDFDVSVYVLRELTGRAPGNFGWPSYIRAFVRMGYSMEPVSDFTAKTVTSLVRDPLLGKGRYLVSVSGGRHAVAMVDGKVIDWTEGRRHRIERIWKVDKEAP